MLLGEAGHFRTSSARTGAEHVVGSSAPVLYADDPAVYTEKEWDDMSGQGRGPRPVVWIDEIGAESRPWPA